uniref:RRM domain-containing protein n=1 Tax=Lactuca sativa TaxID=4236 RepID=A0A9R1WXE8_LACSA|nr:hypothetical protein LSAT_V11C800393650 [Lactuca sativa]
MHKEIEKSWKFQMNVVIFSHFIILLPDILDTHVFNLRTLERYIIILLHSLCSYPPNENKRSELLRNDIGSPLQTGGRGSQAEAEIAATPTGAGPNRHQSASADEIRTLWIDDLQYWMEEQYLVSCFAQSGENFRLNWASLGVGEKRADGSPDFTIFVGDLAADVTNYTLQETFRAHYQSYCVQIS